jgi:uncharacterized protein
MDIIGLIMRHWNAITDTLRAAMTVADVYLPVLLEAEDGIARGNDWAQGFMRGVRARPTSWRPLIEGEAQGGLLLPMMLFAHEHDPDPTLRPGAIPVEKREEFMEMMVASLTKIYRFFEPQRLELAHAMRDNARMPLRRTGPKVGRNDACPCGSGRKYKHCCAASVSGLH